MRLKSTIIVIIILLLFIHNYSVKAQDKNGSTINIDTISEKVIYEYDTVYVAPDTLKLTDTIVYYQVKSKSIKEKKNLNFFVNLNPLQNISEKWSIGIGANAFIRELNNKNRTVDSFYVKKTINFSYEIHINYDLNRFRYSLGLGFASYHEQLEYQKILNLNNSFTSIGSYDSLSVTNKCTATNYYQYLNVFFNLGKKWGKGPFFFVLNSYFPLFCFLLTFLLFFLLIELNLVKTSS